MKINHGMILITTVLCILGSSLLTFTARAQEPAYSIEWQGLTIKTTQDIPAISKTMGLSLLSPGDELYYFVQFSGPITSEMKEQVTQAGGDLLTYVPNNSYITRINAPDLSKIKELSVIRWVGVYQPAMRLSANLRSLVMGEDRLIGEDRPVPGSLQIIGPEPTIDANMVTVRLFRGADVAAIEQAAKDSGGEVIESNSRDRGAILRVRVTPAQAAELARANGVMLIEEFKMPKLYNDIGRDAIGVTPVANTLGLQGSGQVVGIADSGIDSGLNDSSMHADLAGRIVAINSWPVRAGSGATNVGADDGAADIDGGHGTHTVGSLAGNGSVSGGLHKGTAPEASIVFQAVEQWTTWPGGSGYTLVGLPLDLNDLFQEAYDNGVRVHSNSWGSDDDGAYTAKSENVDEFVWDNPDMLIVFAAGNAGVDSDLNNVIDLDSIGAPGTAKNALTIGASENNRPAVQQTWRSSYGNVIDVDQQANNINGIAAFSSRGPTDNLRTKPDLVAPGTMVASIRTQASPNTVWFADNMEAGVNGWTGQGTWGQVTNDSNSAATSWHDSPAGNYLDGTNISLTSPSFNINGGGQGNKALQFFARYNLGTGDDVWLEVSSDGGANWGGLPQPLFQGIQPAWELTTIGLGGFSNVTNLMVRLRLQANNDGNAGDGLYVDDFRITEGAFGTALLSDFGIETAGSVNDTNYMLSNGTSMATPLTAGAAAIVRQYYTEVMGKRYVSAALIRATLINGAVDLSPGQYGSGASQELATAPDNAQGWGRVSLDKSLLPTAPAQLDFIDELAGLETGGSRNYELEITDVTVPMSITMVYHDFPGAALINNLDLTVMAPDGVTIEFPNGLAAVDSINNVERIVIPTPVMGTYTIRVNAPNIPNGPQPYALVTSAGGSITDRQPVDLMLALDMSGSMLSPACPGCEPKLDVLKDAVELFVQLWTAIAIPTDRIGVTYFRTNIDELDIGGTTLLEVTSNAEAIIDDVQSQTTVGTNLTAMGGGIQTSVGELSDVSRQRSVVLFTDGMQNVNPMVLEVDDSPPPGNFHLEINDQVGRPSSGVLPTMPPMRLDPALGIKVNTIGVGSSTPFQQLLTNIASETDGVTKLTIAPDNDLRRFFVEELIDALRDFSPQLVDYRKNTLSGDESIETFELNNGAHQVIFKVSWKRGDKIDFQVIKNGVDLTRSGHIINGPFYKIYTLDLPTDVQGNIIGSGGQWELKISGSLRSSYEVAAIVDEDQLDYSLSLSEGAAVGDSIKMGVRLMLAGKPVTDATVRAKVLKPGASLGTLLSKTSLPSSQTSFEPNLTIGQKKIQLLMQTPEFYKQIEPKEITINLQSASDGSYLGVFDETDLTGAYSVIFEIDGHDQNTGKYGRTEERSFIVHFGKPDFSRSSVQLVDKGNGKSQRLMELQIRPRDHAGNYLGPDYGHKIKVDLSHGATSQDIVDHGDGTYSTIFAIPMDIDPELRIRIMDKPLFKGHLSDFDDTNPRLWIILILILLFLLVWIVYQRRRA